MKYCFVALLTVTISHTAAVSFAQEISDASSLANRVQALEKELGLLKAQRADDARILVPVGTIVAFWGTTPPSGWLLCDGKKKLDKPKYANLKALAGDIVPDLSGVFLRGIDIEGKRDSKRTIGNFQSDENKEHRHKMDPAGRHNHSNRQNTNFTLQRQVANQKVTASSADTRNETRTEPDIIHSFEITYDGEHDHKIHSSGTESRPKNIAVSYIIKY